MNKDMTPQEVAEKWAAEIRRIYNSKTAGDYTFIGVLYHFYMEMKQAEKYNGRIMEYRPSFKLMNAATGETVVQHIIASAFAYMEDKANDNQEDMKYWEESIAFWVQQLTKNG